MKAGVVGLLNVSAADFSEQWFLRSIYGKLINYPAGSYE
jgi:hypothetical protein